MGFHVGAEKQVVEGGVPFLKYPVGIVKGLFTRLAPLPGKRLEEIRGYYKAMAVVAHGVSRQGVSALSSILFGKPPNQIAGFIIMGTGNYLIRV
jgi:hypothetical protein